MNANDVRTALRSRYSDGRRYAIAEEVGLTTGYSHRRIDMMVIDCYASNGFRLDGIEIKISKADLKRELEDPEKHVAFFDVIDYYTLACPKGIADKALIPPKWGILQVNDDLTTRYVRRPIALHDDKPKAVPRGFMASLVRSIQGRDPATQELEAQYKRGVDDERKRQDERRKYTRDRLMEKSEELEKYHELCRRLSIYGDQEEALQRFEQIQKLGLSWLVPSLKRNIKSMQDLVDRLSPDKE